MGHAARSGVSEIYFRSCCFSAAVGLSRRAGATPRRRARKTVPGNPDALGTSRVLVLEPGELTPRRLDAVSANSAARRQGSRAHLRRRPAAALFRPRCSISSPRNASRRRISSSAKWRRRIPRMVRRDLRRRATPSARTARIIRSRFQKLPIEKLRWEIDQGIADVGGGARRSQRAGAVLPHPRARAHGRDRERACRALARRLQLRYRRRRLVPPHQADATSSRGR